VAEITYKRQGEMQQAVLKVLKDAGEELPAREVIQRVERELPPTEFESADYPGRPGVRRFDKVVRFNTIGPVKAGWLIETKDESYRLQDAKARTRSAKRGTASSAVRDGVPNQPTGTVDQAPATE
jgi:hypothetical protein